MADKKTAGLDYGRIGMSMSQIKEYLIANYFGGIARERMPKATYIAGAPGEGKTFTVIAAARAIARRLNQPCVVVDIPTSCLEPCDVSGVPFPIDVEGTNTYFKYLGPDWAWFASKEFEQWERMRRNDPKWTAPAMILFFDDLVAAHFQTQSAFFKGVHQGIWGALHQRENVMTVGAGNRVEDNAGANDMPTALGSRFRHCYAMPTVEDWLTWGGGYREKDEPGKVGEERIHPLVRAYMRMCHDDFREFNEDVAARSEKAFACARTWEDVSELLYENQVTVDNAIFGRAVMGIIGQGIATKFLGFLRNSTKAIPPEQIVRDPEKAPVPNKQSIDALHATVTSLESYIKSHPDTWKAGIVYSMRKEIVPDIGICLAQTVLGVVNEMQPKARAAALGDPCMMNLFDRYEDLLDVIQR